MEIHYTAYFVLMALATFGAIFAPRVRDICFTILILSLLGYGISELLSEFFGNGRDGFLRALIDVNIGVYIASRFNSIHHKIIAVTFAISTYAHTAMTLAYIDKNATWVYTNYEFIIAATSIIQAVLIFGGYYRDAYRNIADRLYRLQDSTHSMSGNSVNKDAS